MTSNSNSPKDLLPVTCPACKEKQNALVGGFDTDGLPAGEVRCMVCRHLFTRDEYLHALDTRRKEFGRLKEPSA